MVQARAQRRASDCEKRGNSLYYLETQAIVKKGVISLLFGNQLIGSFIANDQCKGCCLTEATSQALPWLWY